MNVYSGLRGLSSHNSLSQFARVLPSLLFQENFQFAIGKGIAKKQGVRNRNRIVCKRFFSFAHVCSRLLAFSPLRLLAFVYICLLAFARIRLTPPLSRPPLCDTE